MAPQPYQGKQLIIPRHKVDSLTATEHSSSASSWAVPTHGQLLQHHTLGHGRGSPVAFISPRDLLWLLHRVPRHPSTARRGSHRIWGCLNLLWVLRAAPRPGEIRHPQWVLLHERSGCSGVKEWGIYARTNWAPMPEPEGHSCKNTPGDHAWTNWALVRKLCGCFYVN